MNSPTDLAPPQRERILLRTDAQGVATLTLNRPKQYNALSEELLPSCSRCWSRSRRTSRCAWW